MTTETAAATPDFRVELVMYNNHILTVMEQRPKLMTKGKPSIEALATAMGFKTLHHQKEIRDLIGLKTRPTEEDGSWKPIATALEVEPDLLFPGSLRSRVPSRHSYDVRVKIGEMIPLVLMRE